MGRTFQARGAKRRMNWLGSSGFTYTTVTPGNQSAIVLYDPTGTSTEESKYVNPTLTRIRGWVGMDPSFSGAGTSSDFTVGFAAIVCLRGNQTLDLVGTAGNWSNDGILWSALGVFAQNTQNAGGAQLMTSQQQCKEFEVDVGSMRKLGDDVKVYLTVGVPSSGNVGVSFVNILRLLVKE